MVILYADDDPDDCEFFCDAVKHIDASIICMIATNGTQAMDILHGDLQLPDYIFLDINMPVMDGKKCLAEIKSHHEFKQIPVVMFSTTSSPAEIKEYKQLGAADFIVKPNEFIKLRDTLTLVLTTLRTSRG